MCPCFVSDYQKALAARQTLDGQMNENALVKEVCIIPTKWLLLCFSYTVLLVTFDFIMRSYPEINILVFVGLALGAMPESLNNSGTLRLGWGRG